ncbi:MAG: DUF1549 domain-containing protein, partial [Planctomycetaceae bacterium]
MGQVESTRWLGTRIERFRPRLPGLLRAVLAATASWLIPVCACGAEHPVSFINEVMPVLTKAGCNVGVCHAKAGGGQNGFQLSLLGFEPLEDYEHLTVEDRGRRLFAGVPERSLLLRKASGLAPHGGGIRLPTSSAGFATVEAWIRQGAAYDDKLAPVLTKFAIEPRRGSIVPNGQQQLSALARYSDGSVRDVTDLALYESNDAALAEVSDRGLVTARDQTGKVAVMVRYQGKVAVFSATIPLGAPVDNLPPARNFIDERVFSSLKEIGIPPSPVCDDATFLRRVTLDITGRLPTENETARFLSATSADRRDNLINDLLDSQDYADFFATKWTALLKNRRDDASDIVSNFAFHS